MASVDTRCPRKRKWRFAVSRQSTTKWAEWNRSHKDEGWSMKHVDDLLYPAISLRILNVNFSNSSHSSNALEWCNGQHTFIHPLRKLKRANSSQTFLFLMSIQNLNTYQTNKLKKIWGRMSRNFSLLSIFFQFVNESRCSRKSYFAQGNHWQVNFPKN